MRGMEPRASNCPSPNVETPPCHSARETSSFEDGAGRLVDGGMVGQSMSGTLPTLRASTPCTPCHRRPRGSDAAGHGALEDKPQSDLYTRYTDPIWAVIMRTYMEPRQVVSALSTGHREGGRPPVGRTESARTNPEEARRAALGTTEWSSYHSKTYNGAVMASGLSAQSDGQLRIHRVGPPPCPRNPWPCSPNKNSMKMPPGSPSEKQAQRWTIPPLSAATPAMAWSGWPSILVRRGGTLYATVNRAAMQTTTKHSRPSPLAKGQAINNAVPYRHTVCLHAAEMDMRPDGNGRLGLLIRSTSRS